MNELRRWRLRNERDASWFARVWSVTARGSLRALTLFSNIAAIVHRAQSLPKGKGCFVVV